eukprot:9503379-Pyramimonas_sp.AAC.1
MAPWRAWLPVPPPPVRGPPPPSSRPAVRAAQGLKRPTRPRLGAARPRAGCSRRLGALWELTRHESGCRAVPASAAGTAGGTASRGSRRRTSSSGRRGCRRTRSGGTWSTATKGEQRRKPASCPEKNWDDAKPHGPWCPGDLKSEKQASDTF